MGRMGKRGNGEGSIYEVAGRGWRGAVTLGRKPNGKPNIKVVGGATRKEVATKLDRLIDDNRKGIVSAPDKLTVASLSENWLRDTVAARDQSNTYEYYEMHSRLHVVPAIGHIRLNDLRPDHIRKMLNDCREKTSRFGKPLSPRSIKAVHETISAMLESAVRDQVLERNVAKLVQNNFGKQVREAHSNFALPTVEQAAHLLEAIKGSKWRSFIVVAIMLGIRRGEVCALRWQDVDLENGWVRIWNEIQRVRVHRLKEQPTTRFSGAGSRMAALKTGAKSRRDIELSSMVMVALMEQAQLQKAQKEKAGDRWNEQDFIFTSDQGDHWHPDTATKVFAELREEANLPDTIHLHTLRHVFASAQLAAGVHPKLVQQQLGHSRIQTTLDKYSHFMPGARSIMPSTMEAFITRGTESLKLNPVATKKQIPVTTTITTKPVLEMKKRLA